MDDRIFLEKYKTCTLIFFLKFVTLYTVIEDYTVIREIRVNCDHSIKRSN